MTTKPASLRQLFHLVSGLTLTFLVFLLGVERALLFIGSLFLITLFVESLRLFVPAINRIFISLVGFMLKDPEVCRPTGVGYFLGGISVCLVFFDVRIALASMVILAVGDPAAAVVGQRWGQIRMGEKSLEGTAAFLVAALIGGVVLHGLWPGLPLAAFAAGVVAGAVAECLPLKIDDNLILPVAAALVIEISMRYL